MIELPEPDEYWTERYNKIPRPAREKFHETWPVIARVVWWNSNSLYGEWPVRLWREGQHDKVLAAIEDFNTVLEKQDA